MRIIARLNVGGPAQHVIHLTNRLKDTYPTLLVSGDTEPNEVEINLDKFGNGTPHYRIPELGRRIRPFQDVAAFIALIRLLRRVRPEIVHTHTAKAGTLGRLAAWLTGVPIRVHTYHGHVFHGYFGWLGNIAVRWVERALALVTHRIIAISQSQADELTQRFRICATKKVDVVPLGLELERFRHADPAHVAEFRREIGVTEDQRVVTTVGRLEPIKNHKLLLTAAHLLGNPRVVYVFVGGGSEEVVLREHARSLGLVEQVRFLGWRADLPEIYAASDVVVMTSYNEGTPVSLIEALAAGRRIISTNVGGVADVLQHGKHGTLVPSDRADVLAEELARTILEEPDRAGREVSANYVLDAFSVARLVADVAALYARLRSPGLAPTPSALPQSELTA